MSFQSCECPRLQALGPAVQRRAEWDIMVAHGLGVDHAGHAHDVGSPQMLAKLRETDAHIEKVHLNSLQR